MRRPCCALASGPNRDANLVRVPTQMDQDGRFASAWRRPAGDALTPKLVWVHLRRWHGDQRKHPWLLPHLRLLHLRYVDVDLGALSTRASCRNGGQLKRHKQRGRTKRVFDTLVCTITYALWKNGNAWVFEDEKRQHGPIGIAALVAKEYNLLIVAYRENVRDQNDAARE
jgi:hypothetical protein